MVYAILIIALALFTHSLTLNAAALPVSSTSSTQSDGEGENRIKKQHDVLLQEKRMITKNLMNAVEFAAEQAFNKPRLSDEQLKKIVNDIVNDEVNTFNKKTMNNNFPDLVIPDQERDELNKDFQFYSTFVFDYPKTVALYKKKLENIKRDAQVYISDWYRYRTTAPTDEQIQSMINTLIKDADARLQALNTDTIFKQIQRLTPFYSQFLTNSLKDFNDQALKTSHIAQTAALQNPIPSDPNKTIPTDLQSLITQFTWTELSHLFLDIQDTLNLPSNISNVTMSANGSILAFVVSANNQTKMYLYIYDHAQGTYRASSSTITIPGAPTLTISNDGSTLVARDTNKALHVFSRQGDTFTPALPTPQIADRFALSKDGSTIAALDTNKALHIFSRQDNTFTQVFTTQHQIAYDFALSNDGSTLVERDSNKALHVFIRQDKTFTQVFTTQHQIASYDFTLSNDGSTLVAQDTNMALHVFIRQDNTFTPVLTTPAYSFKLSNDGSTLATRDTNEVLHVFIRQNNTFIPALTTSQIADHFALSDDGSTIVAPLVDTYAFRVFIRQGNTFTPVLTISHRIPYDFFTLSNDGSTIVAQTGNKVLHVFSRQGNTFTPTPTTPHKTYFNNFTLSNDGSNLAVNYGSKSAVYTQLDPVLYTKLNANQKKLLTHLHASWLKEKNSDSKTITLSLDDAQYKTYQSLPDAFKNRFALLTPAIKIVSPSQNSSSSSSSTTIAHAQKHTGILHKHS